MDLIAGHKVSSSNRRRNGQDQRGRHAPWPSSPGMPRCFAPSRPSPSSLATASSASASLPGSYRYPLGSGLLRAVLYYVFTLASVYAFGLIINALAPNFGSKQNPRRPCSCPSIA